VVADDIDLRITHIIRGSDHISNTPKQVLLYQALGAALPTFAHVPLILGPDKTRLSKRHGATSVMSYRDEGIVPEAFRNFLALLGWTPPEGTPEILGDAELIRLFGLEGISRSNAVFDRAKLDWFNTEYIRAYPAERLLPLIEQEWKKAGIEVTAASEPAIEQGRPDRAGTSPEGADNVSPGRKSWDGQQDDRSPVGKAQAPDSAWLLSTIDMLKPRARSLKDFAGSFRAFFTDEFEADPAAVEKFLQDDSVRKLLVELGERYVQASDFTEADAEKVLRDFAAEKGVKAGVLINGARVALTGQGVAPSLFAVMKILGKDRTTDRLKAAATLAAGVTVIPN
jgi:glutamyl-tRNA synthetase